MALTSSITQPIFSSLFSSIIVNIDEVIRNYTLLTAGAAQYFTIQTRTAAGPFEWQGDVFCSESSTPRMILGNSSGAANSMWIDGQDIRLRDNAGATISSAGDKLLNNKFYTLSIKRLGTTVTIKNAITNEVLAAGTSSASYIFNRIGIRESSAFPFNGYLANVHFISGFDANPLYKIDETWANGSAVLVDSNGSANGTAVNIDADDSQPFTRNNDVSPNVLVNNDGSISLPIAGT